ncbi:MAG: hypothetical protein ACJAVA_000215 [Flavobacteriaceae bacterium]|jgi:hypothetical protein
MKKITVKEFEKAVRIVKKYYKQSNTKEAIFQSIDKNTLIKNINSGISTRLKNILGGIYGGLENTTLGNLEGLSTHDFMSKRNAGIRTLVELENLCDCYNINLI